jgi:hypothetical protein
MATRSSSNFIRDVDDDSVVPRQQSHSREEADPDDGEDEPDRDGTGLDNGRSGLDQQEEREQENDEGDDRGQVFDSPPPSPPKASAPPPKAPPAPPKVPPPPPKASPSSSASFVKLTKQSIAKSAVLPSPAAIQDYIARIDKTFSDFLARARIMISATTSCYTEAIANQEPVELFQLRLKRGAEVLARMNNIQFQLNLLKCGLGSWNLNSLQVYSAAAERWIELVTKWGEKMRKEESDLIEKIEKQTKESKKKKSSSDSSSSSDLSASTTTSASSTSPSRQPSTEKKKTAAKQTSPSTSSSSEQPSD